jgi:PncC family amidohydrolase
MALAGVSASTLSKFGAVSVECASEMALGVQGRLGTDIAVSFTGNAGPTVMEDKPAGLTYCGIVFRNNLAVKTFFLEGLDRNEYRNKIVELAISSVIETIKGEPYGSKENCG